MPYEKKPEDIGTLWMNKSKDGTKVYWKGEIQGVGAVVCFPFSTPGGKRGVNVKLDKPKAPAADPRPESVPSWDELTDDSAPW